MNHVQRSITGLLLALVSVSALAQNQRRILDVTVGGGTFQRGSDVTIGVRVGGTTVAGTPGRLSRGSSNARAWYIACSSVDENGDPGPSALSVFCDLKDQQTRLAVTASEPADELLVGGRHDFKTTLNLPERPAGSKLWIIVGTDYDNPSKAGGHEQVVGWTSLLYRCSLAGTGLAKSTAARCAYYTPAAFAIQRNALEREAKTVHP